MSTPVPLAMIFPLVAAEAVGSGAAGTVVALIAGVVVIAWLVARQARRRREYEFDLAEQVRLLADEQQKVAAAVREKEALARESLAKSEMLATLSREIRAHLNGVIGSADLMLENSLPPTQRDHLARLRSSAQSLLQSLIDISDYSSIEAGKIHINSAPFDLRQPAAEVIDQVAPWAGLNGLDFVLIVAPDVPVNVTGDGPRIKQVLLNLMANAVRFCGGTGRIVVRIELPKVSLAPARDGAASVHFSVNDDGPGLPQEALASLFDPIGRTESGARRAAGSGLELAIAKRLVELMGGEIGAMSGPDSGTELWMVLPLIPDKVQPVPVFSAVEEIHAMVLDHVAASRIAVTAMLARLGLEADATDTVPKAVLGLRDGFDESGRNVVLLLDESVAKSSAERIALDISQDAALQSVRIILLAHDPETLAASLPFPIAATLPKPLVRADALMDVLRRAQEPGKPRIAGSRSPFESRREVAASSGRGPHVLVVDDDAISRSVSHQLLEFVGCTVEVAHSGADAIARSERTAFDLILMDCQMPELDGFATTERIRAKAGAKAPPIVAVTANTSVRDRERCFAVGMCDFVGKPLTKAEVSRVVKRWTAAGSASQVRVLQ